MTAGGRGQARGNAVSQPSWGALWKCRQAWLEGVSQLNRGNTAVAAEMFGVAVSHNPEAADAWLGLHASGVRRDEALEAMDRHAHSSALSAGNSGSRWPHGSRSAGT